MDREELNNEIDEKITAENKAADEIPETERPQATEDAGYDGEEIPEETTELTGEADQENGDAAGAGYGDEASDSHEISESDIESAAKDYFSEMYNEEEIAEVAKKLENTSGDISIEEPIKTRSPE